MSADTKFDSGAVRSGDAAHLDFTSIPLIGLLAVARTSGEGADKYGRYNYMKGMPVHDLLNHVLRHIILYLLGDRSEPHLPHAAWGLLAAIQSQALDPELSAPHLLSPGATLGPDMKALMESSAPGLKALRESGHFQDGDWCLHDLPEVHRVLDCRKAVRETEDHIVRTRLESDARREYLEKNAVDDEGMLVLPSKRKPYTGFYVDSDGSLNRGNI